MTEEKKQYLVLDLTPRTDQASKPTELIRIKGHQALSLSDRRSITLLWHNAHRQGVEPGKKYTIELDELIGNHKGYERIRETIEALMQTLITVTHPNGDETRVQFLGGNNLSSPSRAAGTLTYRFDEELLEILRDSSIWGKISLPVLMALSSKYAVSLYENVSQWTGLDQKIYQKVSLAEFREILGIEDSKYPAFGALNKHVVKPAIREINALASFSVTIMPVKTGKKVTHIHIGWSIKSQQEIQDAYAELSRPKVGRKARISNQTEMVLEPSPSLHKITKRAPKTSL